MPLLVFAAIAYGAVSMVLDPLTPTRITLSVLVVATIEARLILCLARAVLLPVDDGVLFLPIDAETRNYLYIWVKRFTYCGIFGYAVPASRVVARAFPARSTPCCSNWSGWCWRCSP